MVIVGVQTDAAARANFIPGLFFKAGVVNYRTLGLRQLLHVRAKDVVKRIEVVPGATDGGRRHVVLAVVVSCEAPVELKVGRFVALHHRFRGLGPMGVDRPFGGATIADAIDGVIPDDLRNSPRKASPVGRSRGGRRRLQRLMN